MSTRVVRALWGVAALGMLLGSNGCALRINLTTTPYIAAANAPVQFDLSITNDSACPADEIVAVLVPFIPADELVFEGDEDIAELLEALFEAVCTGQSFEIGDLSCRFVGNQIVCELDEASTTPDSSQGSVATADGPLITCRREGGTITCEAPAVQDIIDGNPAALQTLNCAPDNVPPFGDVILCSSPLLAPGEAAENDLTLNAPGQSGLYRSFLFAIAIERNVCISGANAGQPCNSSLLDCGGLNLCAPGVCVDNNTGASSNGCNSNANCTMSQTCVNCVNSLDTILPFACSQTIVGRHAPATSYSGMAAAATALLAMGWFGLARLRRRDT